MVKLYKPTWVSHDGNPIFSCDVHPDGSRFATGGQGQDCGQVCIWSMGPVLRADEEKKDSVPKLLCQLTNHLACVNCVRWSHDGRFLASTGDDKTIMIWQIGRTLSGPGSYGAAFGKANVEQWRTVSCLKGHDGDILDVSWSPCDQYIASCSVDTTCIIWSTKRWHDRVAILKGHQGFVKGVSWDPVGKYIATQSDDKTIRVWRTHDWQQECVIKGPFEECGGTTHVLRLNWSPDGQYLVSAHAMNNGGPTAQIIERGSWKTDKDFVGHRKAVTVVRFFPSIMKRTGKDGQMEYFACLAIGSRDCSVSVWLNDKRRPLCVVHNLFTNSVVDACWNPVSSQLLVCSSDGSLAVLDFSIKELGQPISADERASLFHKMYGIAGQASGGLSTVSNLLVENVDVLKAHEKAKTNGLTIPAPRPAACHQSQSNASISSSQRLAKGPTDRQIETIMPNGRRRITPLYIPLDQEVSDSGMPMFSSSTMEKSRIVVEKRESNSLPPVASMAPATLIDEPRSAIHSRTKEPPSFAEAAPNHKVPHNNNKEDAVPASSSAAPTSVAVPVAPIIASNAAVPGKGKPKRIKATMLTGSTAQEPAPTNANLAALHPAQEAAVEQQKQQNHQAQQLVGVSSSSSSVNVFPRTRLRQPFVIKVDSSLAIEVVTEIPAPGGSTLSRVVCKAISAATPTTAAMHNEVWDAVLAGRLAAVAATNKVICTCGEDQLLTVFCAKTGCRLSSSLVISSSVAQLVCRNTFCMIVTTDGKLTVYDTDRVSATSLKRVLCEDLKPLVSANRGSPLRFVNIVENQHAIVAFSNGKSYLYEQGSSSWCLVSATSDLISQCSDHYSSLPSYLEADGPRGPLERIQSSMFRGGTIQRNRNSLLTNPSIQRSTTLAFIEQEINAAKALGSRDEYRYWLATQVRYLTQEGMELRLRHVLDELLGPVGAEHPLSWNPLILDLPKRDLLDEVLPFVATNLKLQRVFVEYNNQLKTIQVNGPSGKLPRVTSLRAQQTTRVNPKAVKRKLSTVENGNVPSPETEPVTPNNVRVSDAGKASPLKKTPVAGVRKRGRPPKNAQKVRTPINGINGQPMENGSAQAERDSIGGSRVSNLTSPAKRPTQNGVSRNYPQRTDMPPPAPVKAPSVVEDIVNGVVNAVENKLKLMSNGT